MENYKEQKEFSVQYDEMIQDKNFYRLFLSVKTDLRKLIKKNSSSFFDLMLWTLGLFKENNEKESSLSLFSYCLTEVDKNFNRNDVELYLDGFRKGFELLPDQVDKSLIKQNLLKFCESKGISDLGLQKHSYYKIFARDSLTNNDFASAYRFAVKSSDFQTVSDTIDAFGEGEDKQEKSFLITRTVLELIMQKNLIVAKRIIVKYVDTNNNFQNNPPILNFAFFLTGQMSQDMTAFDRFWTLINLYKEEIEKDPSLSKYLNKISTVYYNKPFLKENSMNLMNIFKAFS